MDPVPKASAKGKRDINVPRITYHAGSRTFDRLFKEQSLHETEDVVRKKLGLPEDCEFRLAQLRGKHVVDLEDDDDFDAFHAIAHEQMAVEVLVIIEGDDDRPTTSERTAIKSISRSSEISSSSSEIPNEKPADNPATKKRKVAFADKPPTDSQNVPPKKRRMSTSRPSTSSSESSTSNDIQINLGGPATYDPDSAQATESRSEDMPPKKRQKRAKSPSADSDGHFEPTDAAAITSQKLHGSTEKEIGSELRSGSTKKGRKANENEADFEHMTGPGKKQRKANGSIELKDGPEHYASPAVNISPEAEASPKKKTKRKTKKNSELATSSTSATAKSPIIADKPVTVIKRSKNSTKQNEADAIQFNQDLAEKITGAASKHGEHASVNDGDPPRKRAKRRNSVAGSNSRAGTNEEGDGEATEPVVSRTYETAGDGKVRQEKKKKGEKKTIDMKLTSSQRAAVKDRIASLVRTDIQAAVAAAAAAKSDASTPALRKPTSAKHSSHPAPKSSSAILAAAKSDGMDRPASKSKKVDGNVTPISNPKNDTRVPARVSASESSDDEDEDEDNTPAVNKPPVSSPASTPKVRDVYAHVDLEELVRGPSNKRLTLDSVLPVAIASSRKHNAVVLEEDPIVKTKPIRKSLPVKASIWSDVDSDDPGSESASASGLAEAESPNPVETSTLPSVLSAKESNMPVSAVPSAIPEVSALPGQVSFVAGTPVNQGTTEWSIQLPDSLKPSLAFGQDYSSRNNAARIEADRESSVPETPTEEHDPIEPVIPSPRPKSPIEPSLPTVDSLSEETRPNTSTFSKPDTIIPVPRWSARKTASQPISKHEAEIRESVVRLTRSRSKQTVHAPNPPGPSSTVIISPSVKRALPASQPVRVTTPGEPDSAVRETNAEPMWTTLNVGSSSAVDADSSHGSDELQSNGGHEMEASAIRRRASAGPLLSSNPLFISSESQVDFPYSQFQDLDVETDTGVQEAISALSRLEEDSEEEEEVEETVIAKSSKHSSTGFRGLSQIASQTFFTGFKSPSVFFSTPKSPKDSDMYGPLSQAYEDDMSDSESELEAEKSHIPKARRAGNKH